LELAEKQKQADSALKEITSRMMEASEQKKEMEILNGNLHVEEGQMLSRKQAVEKELAEVEPIILSAKAAVGEIRSDSISEIRSLRAPPPAIRDVLEGVLRLMGNLDMSWNSMKGFLGQRTVKEEIMNFDVRNITKQTREAVELILKEKKESFEDSVIKRSSVAAAPLAVWVKANLQYAAVVEKVAPMEKELQALTKSLNSSKMRVQSLKEALDQVDSTVEELRAGFGTKTREAETLRMSLEKAMYVIQNSQGLLEKLSGEGSRWSSQVNGIENSIKCLPREALVSSSFVIYLGNASEYVRQTLVSQWCQITNVAKSYNFCSAMSR
jgi:dynein heavy chain 2, cytosolic